MKTILVIQHTQSIHHTNGMIGGWTDWDLTEQGRKEAQNICNALKEGVSKNNYILYTSDLKRAMQTAEPFTKLIKTEPNIRQELREISDGEATGKSRDWGNENKLPNIYNSVYSEYKAFKNSESYFDVWNRLKPFMNEILNSEFDNIIIVSHGIALHLFFALWLGFDFDDLNHFGLWGLSGGVSKLIVRDNGRREIQYLNNLSFKAISK